MTTNAALQPAHAVTETTTLTVHGFVARPHEEVYEAVADPAILSEFFTTGGAQGRLDTGIAVTWDFHDYPGRFPVYPVEFIEGERLVFEWESADTTAGKTVRVIFEFEPADDGARTEVTITEGPYALTPEGVKAAIGNTEGWTGMLAALKTWLEHGINLREGFYA